MAHHAARLGPELPLQQVASAGAHVSNAGDTQLLLQLLLHGPAHARQIPHSQLQQLLVCLQVLTHLTHTSRKTSASLHCRCIPQDARSVGTEALGHI